MALYYVESNENFYDLVSLNTLAVVLHVLDDLELLEVLQVEFVMLY